MPKGVPSVRRSLVSSASVAGLFGLGLVPLGNVAVAQTVPGITRQQPSYPLSGYVLEVSGSSARLSLSAEDDVQPGDEFSALQYGEEIARLRIKRVTKTESIADVLLQKPGVVLRRLDTVVPSTAITKPAPDLAPIPPTPPERELKPQATRRTNRRSRKNPGEIVSRSDWAYPALSTLAKENLLPNVASRQFHGDQQLTRAEVRELVAEAVQNREQPGGALPVTPDPGSPPPAREPVPAPSPSLSSATPGTPPQSGSSQASATETRPAASSPELATGSRASVAPAPAPTTSEEGRSSGSPRSTVITISRMAPSESAPPTAVPAGSQVSQADAPPPAPAPPAPNAPAPRPDLAAVVDPATEPVDRLLFHLAREYEVETDLPAPRKGPALSAISRFRIASGDGNNIGSTGAYQGLMHLGPERYAVLSLSRGRREWYGDHDYPWLNEAFLKTNWLGVDWQIGQKALRWGPGYSGSLMLSDVAPTLPMIRGQRTWSLGRILGRLNVEQFASRFREYGDAKYFLGRRISRALGSKLTLGLTETAKSQEMPNPGILFLPFQLYQRWFEKDNNVINIQAGADLHYRSGSHEAYGEFFIDDITAPAGLRDQGKVPRKIGVLLGYRRANLFGREGTDLRVEWAQSDRNTYLHRNPSVSYYQRGLTLGHPMGPNAESLMVRLDRRINPKLEMMTAVQVLSQRSSAPPVAAKGTAFTLAAAYDFSQDRSLIVKLSPSRRVDRYQVPNRSVFEMIVDWAF